jgi:UDP-glucose 4-epimerase
MKILVTGGCGFIGSNIVNRLVTVGHQVQVLDDLTSGKKKNIQSSLDNKNCQLKIGSITNLSLLTKIMKGCDLVIHEAANPDVRASLKSVYEDFNINVKGTINVLQAMIKNEVPKIIFASSGGTVYGETDVLPTPETQPLAPISHYGATKACCEQYLSSYSSLHDLEVISLRLGNIFGPPSDHGVMYDFYWKLTNDPLKLTILGNGKQTKSYLYIDDCVNAHLEAMKQKFKDHSTFNIATSEGITVTEIANEVVNAMGLKDVEYEYTGGERGWAGDVRKAIADISKAKELLNWEPNISIKEGIQKYITWLGEATKNEKE